MGKLFTPRRSVVRDMAAYAMRAGLIGLNGQRLETRKEPTMDELNATITKIAETVEAMRSKNDERLKEIEKRGTSDVLLTEQIGRMQAELGELKTVRADMEELRKKMGRPQPNAAEGKQSTPEQIEHRKAMLGYLRNPENRQAQDRLQRAEKAAIDAEAKAAQDDFETRAVGTTTQGAGGYAVPTIIAEQVQKNLLEISPLRNLVTTVTVGSKDYKELVDKNGATYGWVGETAARTETGTPTLDQVAPTFGMLYAYPQATEESLADMFFDVEGWLAGAITEGFRAGEENAIVNGNGTNKPTGFLTGTPVSTGDAARAFGVLQYVATGQAADWKATTPFDTFQQVIYTLKKGYRSNASFLMSKTIAGEVSLFKDSQNNYIWRQSVLADQPSTLLGYPVNESEEMPVKAANAFPVAFGDFKAGYLLCDLVGFSLTRDDITTPGYVKWYARRRLGGKIRKSEAIKLIKVAIS